MSDRKCSICGDKHLARGFCSKHYAKFRRSDSYAVAVPATIKWMHENKTCDSDECLTWPFARNKTGYGNVFYDGRYTVASRLMCIFAHGEPIGDFDAAHSCGNGHLGCVNPKHLSWKTKSENESDKISHGTRATGESCSFAKLSWDIVRSIRKDALTMRNKDISEKYGIDRRQISNIVHMKKWIRDPLSL